MPARACTPDFEDTTIFSDPSLLRWATAPPRPECECACAASGPMPDRCPDATKMPMPSTTASSRAAAQSIAHY
eukprot:scaffold11715_cov133-Isochrysis_galbana.AAC.5